MIQKKIQDFLNINFGSEKFAPKISFSLLKELFSPFKKSFEGTKIVAITGTNGKGETAFTLNFLAGKNLLKTCLWTSPHIHQVNERFTTETGMSISDLELWDIFQRAKEELKANFLKLSFYEFIFYAFCLWVKERKPDLIILEVGVGGRLDAINTLDADLCLLTSVSRDHVDLLGNSYEKILVEKLGLTRHNKPLITSLPLHFCQEIVAGYAAKNNIPWIDLFKSIEDFSLKPYFVRNKFLAFVAWKFMQNSAPAFKVQSLVQEFEDSALISSIPTFKARREMMTLRQKSFIFIGAHNAEGMRAVLNNWKQIDLNSKDQYEDEKEIIGLFSFSKRPAKEVSLLISLIGDSGIFKKIYVTNFDHPKAYDQKELEAIVKEYKGNCVEWISDWKIHISNPSDEQKIVVMGSYYFIAELQHFLSESSS